MTRTRGRTITAWVATILFATLFASCRHLVTHSTDHVVDSLCQRAYELRYVNVDSTSELSYRALGMCDGYPTGTARAMNNLAYVRYHQMDYRGALRILDSIPMVCNDQLEQLCADIMKMRVCQRTADWQTFFSAKYNAQRRLQRISNEQDELRGHANKARMQYAQSEYHIINSTYYYYQRNDSAAIAEIEAVAPLMENREDTTQWLNYCYMLGSGGLIEGGREEVLQQEFDWLIRCHIGSQQSGNLYFHANALQSLASMLSDSTNFEYLMHQRPDEVAVLMYQNMPWIQDSTRNFQNIPREAALAMARHSLEEFTTYGDKYQQACVWRTMGEIHFRQNKYEASVDDYSRALEIVSDYHRQFYADSTQAPKLATYDANSQDTTSIEKQWMHDPDIITLPEWISGIRQRLCLSYSAMDFKPASDYNRNIYLDILSATDQDQELKSLTAEVQRDLNTIRWTLAVMLIMIGIIAILLYYFSKRLARHNGHQMQLRHQMLEYCTRLLSKSDDEDEHTETSGNTDNDLEQLIHPYREFLTRNKAVLDSLDEQLEELQEQRYLTQRKLDNNKKNNAERRAKVQMLYAIMPFLDRIVAEVNRMHATGAIETNRLQYIDELTTKIIEYNDILTDWIQMEQGQLSLQVSTLQLQDIFSIVQRGHYAFDQKGVSLTVHPTQLCVKGDEALTLFMINTLAENARKFTPEGGSVTIQAEEGDGYVEISVIDTGCGLSPEDVDTLNNNKVYDASTIGGTEARPHKGFGFGLMNCRGIINKYRKLSQVFSVCEFAVESEQGRGSRFYFRLPRVMAVLCLVLGMTYQNTVQAQDDVLEQAYDSTYQCNIEGRYHDALGFAAAALHSIDYRLTVYADTLLGDTVPTEVDMYRRSEPLDYEYLALIRNEAALAALATHQWDIYNYNNQLHTQLQKLMRQNDNLTTLYQQQAKAKANTRLLILALVILSVVALVLAWMLIYGRMRMGLGLRLVGELNNQMLGMQDAPAQRDQLPGYVERLVSHLFEGLCQMQSLNGIRLTVDALDDEGHNLCQADAGELYGESATYPMLVNIDDKECKIGQLELFGTNAQDEELLQLAIRFLSLILYHAVICTTRQADTITQIQDERNLLDYEEKRLHVQNQVLDNCLSTIKHETMYYPARIMQLSQRLATEDTAQHPATMQQMHELVMYYKEVYTLLSAQAERQTQTGGFKNTRHAVSQVLRNFKSTAQKMMKRTQAAFDVQIQDMTPDGTSVRADAQMLQYLTEQLLRYVTTTAPGNLAITAELQGTQVRFTLHDDMLQLDDEQCHCLFYPQKGNIPLLVAKQIIREHDAMGNHPGLRMAAETQPTGTNIYFTLLT